MPVMSIDVDPDPMKRLLFTSRETARDASELAECAISITALRFFRERDDDPTMGEAKDAQPYASHEENHGTP